MNEVIRVEVLPDLTDIIALIMAFLSIVFTIVFTYLSFSQQRKHNYLSVKPVLKGKITIGDNIIELILYNGGAGPAFVSECKIVYANNSYQSFSDLLNKDSAWMNGGYTTSAYSCNSQSILLGEKIVLLRYDINNQKEILGDDTKKRGRSLLFNLLKETKLMVSYTDIYGHFQEKLNLSISDLL